MVESMYEVVTVEGGTVITLPEIAPGMDGIVIVNDDNGGCVVRHHGGNTAIPAGHQRAFAAVRLTETGEEVGFAPAGDE